MEFSKILIYKTINRPENPSNKNGDIIKRKIKF